MTEESLRNQAKLICGYSKRYQYKEGFSVESTFIGILFWVFHEWKVRYRQDIREHLTIVFQKFHKNCGAEEKQIGRNTFLGVLRNGEYVHNRPDKIFVTIAQFGQQKQYYYCKFSNQLMMIELSIYVLLSSSSLCSILNYLFKRNQFLDS